MFDGYLLLVVLGTFFLAGAIKGVIGLGLPTVSLALLTVAIDLPNAMALLLAPSFITNLWQALVGGNGKVILIRIWPFLTMATLMVWFGATALTTVDLALLSALLGALLIAYALISLLGLHITLTRQQEYWSGPVMGMANGILTGMTGSFVVPGVLFLQAIGLGRDQLIQAMGILFTLSTLALAVALQGNSLVSTTQGLLSAAAVVPALIGMMLGQRIREKLSAQVFRRVFFISLLLLGCYIVANAI